MTKNRKDLVITILTVIGFSPTLLAACIFSLIFLVNSFVFALTINWYKYGFKKAMRMWYRTGLEFFKQNINQ